MIQLLPHKDIYAIPVPLYAGYFGLQGNVLKFDPNIEAGYRSWRSEKLPPGNWEILGEVTKDATSFDVKGFIDKRTLESYRIKDPINIFYVLLAANGGYLENPLDREKRAYFLKGSENSWGHEDLDRWQSFEDKLIQKALIIQNLTPNK